MQKNIGNSRCKTRKNVISDTGKTREEQIENFRYLTSEERVENVIENAKYFGYSGDRVKGLILCNRIDEARALSFKFNERGLRTDALDYILSVDINFHSCS